MSDKKEMKFLVSTKAISVCIVLVLVFSPFAINIQKAHANAATAAIGGFLACSGLSGVFGDVFDGLSEAVSSTVPVADSGVRSATSEIQKITGNQLNKDCSLDAIAYAAAKFMGQEITNSVLDFVQSGFNGEPAFISDPSSYFLNIADREAKEFIYQSDALDNIYGPYQDQLRRTLDNHFIEQTAGRSFKEKSVCNLENLVTDSEGFRSGDFASGGWGAWLEATQNPYCNPYGVNITAKQELDRRVNFAVEEQKVLADWGSGIKSVVDSNGKVTTPGSIIGEQLNAVLGQGFEQLNNADEINEILSAAIGGLTNKIFSRTGLITN
jgi:hypothetical protein